MSGASIDRIGSEADGEIIMAHGENSKRKKQSSSEDNKNNSKKLGSRKKRSRRDDDDESSSSSISKKRRSKKNRSRRYSSDSDSDSDSESSDSDSSDSRAKKKRKKRSKKSSKKKKKKKKSKHSSKQSTSNDDKDDGKVMINERLLAKLEARGETLEERKLRRAQVRAAHIQSTLGYTADDNPFNDPNLHETFTWNKKKKDATTSSSSAAAGSTNKKETQSNALDEITKVRQRREDRELQRAEMDRLRDEESRMREMEGYEEFARKEEEFHLHQQRQRSAIRLVEGREKPVDVLAKNLLLFGLSESQKLDRNGSSVKYQERFNALDALEQVKDAELEEPHVLLKQLKLVELQELLVDIDAFRSLEREAASSIGGGDINNNPVLVYWDSLRLVAQDEVKYLQSGGDQGAHAKLVLEVQKIFQGQSMSDLQAMRQQAVSKLSSQHSNGTTNDTDYWKSVVQQLDVYLAKVQLSELHSKMLVRQLHKLEQQKEELAKQPKPTENDTAADNDNNVAKPDAVLPDNVEAGFGDLEEELGLKSEIDVLDGGKHRHSQKWEEKYRPRKPRFFNRVRTGYDWNKYNQTHYDHDNPPPKIVQGYKFNIFYPDLIDATKTPQFVLEKAGTPEFCIIRFKAGPPYEDVAFKIINREWNKSRKRGYKCTFERGVLSLYFNFTTHWYRR